MIHLQDPTASLLHDLLTRPPELTVAETALEIVDVVKRFGKQHPPWTARLRKQAVTLPSITLAVDHISLEIRRGEIFGLLGANGSGKSTLIRLISTLLYPDAGNITVFGYDVEREGRQVQQLINRVSVEAAFFKKLSAFENLMYAARLYDLPIVEARQQAGAILQQLGLKEKRLSEPLEHMSRGMQQKVAIARGLLTAPCSCCWMSQPPALTHARSTMCSVLCCACEPNMIQRSF